MSFDGIKNELALVSYVTWQIYVRNYQKLKKPTRLCDWIKCACTVSQNNIASYVIYTALEGLMQYTC